MFANTNSNPQTKRNEMKTGREFLKEHIDETNIPAEHWEIEIGEMMDWYADYYHQAKLKELGIANVLGQREQLAAIFEKMNRQHITMLEIGDYNKLAKEILSS